MNAAIKSKSVLYGLILGFLLIIPTLYAYIVDLSVLVNNWMMVIPFFFVIVIGIIAIAAVKKEMGGFISFKEAFSTYFRVVLIALVLTTLVNYIIFNVVDPGAKEDIKQLSIEKVTDVMERFDVPDEALDKAIEEIENTDSFSVANQAKGFVFSLAFYTVFGLLLALILKKTNPELE